MRRVYLLVLYLSVLPFSVQAQENCLPLEKAEGFHIHQCGRVKVVGLFGTPKERAKNFGEIVRKNLSKDVIDYFANKVSDSITLPSPVSGIFDLAYSQFIRLWHRNVPKNYAEELNAYASGLGVDPIYLKKAISLPDTASMLMGLDVSKSLPTLGCTSVAAENSEGNFFYGRNLDFAGVNLWDQHPLILQIFPEKDSNELKHLIFGADGLLFGGISGVNERGITISVHQNYSSDSSVSGIPMIYLGEMVLRSAETLDDALEILKNNRPSVLWTFVITDLQLGKAVAVETSTKRFSIRWMESEGFVQTNHSMHPEFKSSEAITLGTKLNSLFRMKTAFEILLKNSEKIEASTIAKILSYQENPEGFFSAHHDILKAHTIQSLIFAPSLENLGSLFISNDEAPASGGKFLHFSLDQLLQSDSNLSFELKEFERNPQKRSRQKQISQAFHSYFDKKDLPDAISKLKNHPTISSVLFQTSAYYQMEQWQEAVALAEQTLRESKFLVEPTYILQSLKWIRLLALWKLGKKQEAKDLAEELDTEIPLNPRLKSLVKRLKSGKPPNTEDFSIAFEFFSGDLGLRPQ
jgi:tetratricopeptide (TPR) repeat protein